MKNEIARQIQQETEQTIKDRVAKFANKRIKSHNMKLNKDQFLKFLEIVRESLIGNDLRLGQQIWNEGVQLYPDLFEPYRATKYDPFHRNARINDLFEQILDEEAWNHWTTTNTFSKINAYITSSQTG